MAGNKHKKDKTKKKETSPANANGPWPVTYKWVAVGTIMAYTAAGGRTIKIACAQELPGSAQTRLGPATEKSGVHVFNIAPGTLSDVTGEYERVTGIRVSIPDGRLRNINSPGVKGAYSNEQALRQILDDRGIRFKFTGPTAVEISLNPLAQTVTVSEHEANIGLVKYPAPALDTAQTINMVPQHLIQEQGGTTLRDALRNVAGISLAAGEGGSQGDNLTIRGFTARNDIYLDGMRDFGSYYRDSFNDESVSVLQGPSSVMFGRGSTGGVVNQASKSPQHDGFVAGSADLGTDLTRRLAIDIDQPLHALGQNTAFRLNLMGNDSRVADRNVSAFRRYGIAPTIEFGMGTPTRLTLSYFHEWEDDIPDYGIPWLFDRPAPVPRENYYGFTHGNYLKTGDDVGTVKFEHDFSSSLSLRSQVRYANYPRNAVITEPQINAPNTPTTPLDQIVVTRNEIAVKSVESFADGQTDLLASFRTGHLRHSFVAGVEGGRETSDPTRFGFNNTPTTNLLNPTPNDAPPGSFVVRTVVTTTAYSQSAYALDSVQLGRKVQVSGGFRWDRFSTDYAQTVAPATAFHRVDEMPSWRACLVYKPVGRGSLYFDAGTSFNPSAESLSLSAATANTPPERNRTFEVGTKWDLATPRLTAEVSAFRTDKTNAREPDPNNPLLNVLGGNQRVQGIEATFTGHLASRWELLTSYALLHSDVVSSKFYPGSIGYPLANVPQNTFNIWSTYQTRWRHVELGGGGNFVDSRTASSTVPLNPTTGLLKQIPGYWVANAMVRLPITERLDLQLNAFNLTNNYYYDEPHPSHIIPGAGRSLLLSVNFRLGKGGK